MSDSSLVESVKPPPVVPPLISPKKSSPSSLQRFPAHLWKTITDEEARDQIYCLCDSWNLLGNHHSDSSDRCDSANDHVWIMNMPSCLQDGPSCGLAALRMCKYWYTLKESNSSSFDPVPELHEFVADARSKGFTQQGEMLSAFDLASVATDFCNLQARVIDLMQFDSSDLLHYIISGSPVLIPYDCAPNHSPCVKNGKNAHWAVIVGLFIPQFLSDCDLTSKITLWKGISFVEPTDHHSQLPLDVWVLCRQSKSLRLQLWSFKELIESNANLLSVKSASGDHDLSLLRNKAILLHQKVDSLDQESLF